MSYDYSDDCEYLYGGKPIPRVHPRDWKWNVIWYYLGGIAGGAIVGGLLALGETWWRAR